jgi:hypothetical protein
MAVAGAGTLVVAATALREPARRSLRPLLAIAVSPLVVESVFVNQVEFDHSYSQLHAVDPVVWALLARDLLLVLLVALLLNASRTAGGRAS